MPRTSVVITRPVGARRTRATGAAGRGALVTLPPRGAIRALVTLLPRRLTRRVIALLPRGLFVTRSRRGGPPRAAAGSAGLAAVGTAAACLATESSSARLTAARASGLARPARGRTITACAIAVAPVARPLVVVSHRSPWSAHATACRSSGRHRCLNDEGPPGVRVGLLERSPAVSYSPTRSPSQYHRRCRS